MQRNTRHIAIYIPILINHNWNIDVISSFEGADRINKSLFPSSYANKFCLFLQISPTGFNVELNFKNLYRNVNDGIWIIDNFTN